MSSLQTAQAHHIATKPRGDQLPDIDFSRISHGVGPIEVE